MASASQLKTARGLPNTSGHTPELDGVRGIACISIVLLHCIVGLWVLPATPWIISVVGAIFPYLVGGVDLFFVLSGFLIGGILFDHRESPNYFRAFWTRRAARILPVAWALVASYSLALLIQSRCHFPQLSYFALEEPLHSPLWYATFTQSIPFTWDWGPKWMGITWSLAIEEQFYLLFPIAVFWMTRRQIIILAMCGAIISPLIFAIVSYASGREDTAYVLLPCRMYGLFLGVLIACIIRDRHAYFLARRFRLGLDAIILFIVYITYRQWLSTEYANFVNGGDRFLGALFHEPLMYMMMAVFYTLMLLRIFLYEGGIFRAILRNKILAGAGLISYALYMYHQAINGLLHGFIFNHAPQITNLPEFGVSLLVVAIAVGLAVLSYFYLERPIRRWGHRLASYDARPAAQAPIKHLASG